ncbi:MAG: hypothetical protein DRJ50_12755 [Actinobacteria bacterium]|nr:MAG: hypothetical protein DRJ50_12755 [Actinomycetota bacterium]
MDSITVEMLLTVAGITLITGLFVQAIKMLWPGDKPDAQWLRRIALIVAIVLTLIVAVATGVPEGAQPILFYLLAVINGVVAGLAATAAFDTAKYGDARVVEAHATD